MKFTGGKTVIASNALIAAAGAGAMVGLICLINIDTSKPRSHVTVAPKLEKAAAPAVDRWSFAPRAAFAGLPVLADVPELRRGFAPGSDVAEVEAAGASEGEVETASLATEPTAAPWQTDAHVSPRIVRTIPLPIVRTLHRESPQSSEKDDAPTRRRPYNRSLEKRLAEISPGATARLKRKFEDAKVAWPPSEISLIGIKDEKVLELHARAKGGPWQLIHRYRVLAASGSAGPKLRQGDKQVPEGIYRIAWLNPNSAYHVSLRVSYPNTFDRTMAKKDGRSNLGGDIMIHGKNLSAGCLAIGDEAVEEIFTVAAETGLAKVRVIIAPTDLRTKSVPQPKPGQPEWVPKLYTEIASAMSGYEAVNPIATGSTNIASSFMSFFAK